MPRLLPLLLSIALVACDERGLRHAFGPDAGSAQIELGDAEAYRPAGLYFDFIDPHHVVLVSRSVAAGMMLVALDFRCTYDQQPLTYNDLTDRFHCNRCDSRWSTDGLIQSGSVATDSLDRYRMRLTGTRLGTRREVIVDTSRRFHHKTTKQYGRSEVEVYEWSATDSMYHFENDPRIDALKDKVKVE